MARLFGTDGVRGVANTELTPLLAFHLGRAGAAVLTKETAPKILVGTDTRISCDMLEASLTAGMCSVGASVISVGVIPSPAIAYLVRKYKCDAGVMISASHNPFYDNGIKFFNGKGYKLSDEIEDQIEALMHNESKIPVPTAEKIGFRILGEQAKADYEQFLFETMQGLMFDFNVGIDCANGATSVIAPSLLKRLGADIHVINASPNGLNINVNCGSTHMESLCALVKNEKLAAGLAFDGDGDRCLMVDETGKVIDGDQMMSICANFMKEHGELNKDTVVVTVMSNLGFMLMGKKRGINIEVTNVGDRYVLEHMLEKGFVLGGENSGHIIFLNHNTTGDGILSALQVLRIMKLTGKKLSELNTYMEVMPQILINAKVSSEKKHAYLDDEIIKQKIESIESRFAGNGRVLIRPSGTEPKVRVMIEGENLDEITTEAKMLAELIEDRLK